MYDSPEWIQDRLIEFKKRLNDNRISACPNEGSEESLPAPSHRQVVVDLDGVHTVKKKAGAGSIQSGLMLGRTSQMIPQKVINTHEWLKCMDAFAQIIKPLWTSTRDDFLKHIGVTSLEPDKEGVSIPVTLAELENEVVVALIDDGVALLDQHFVGRVLEGKTFDYQDGGVGQSYNSAKGHGTEMARCILRVCPMAKIYPSEQPQSVTLLFPA